MIGCSAMRCSRNAYADVELVISEALEMVIDDYDGPWRSLWSEKKQWPFLILVRRAATYNAGHAWGCQRLSLR